jgi:hypothetical protein
MAPARRQRAGFRKFSKKKIFMARAWHARGSEGTTTGSDNKWTLPVILLGGITENQNSDFVKA